MSASRRITMAFLLGAGAVLGAFVALAALGPIAVGGGDGGGLAAGIALALLALAGGAAGLVVALRGQAREQRRLLSEAGLIEGLMPGARLPGSGDGDLAARLERVRVAYGAFAAGLAAFSRRAQELAAAMGGEIGEIESGGAAQGESIGRAFDAFSSLRSEISGAGLEVELIGQRLKEAAAAVARMDRANGRASELVNGLAVSIEQVSLANREGDRGVKSIARDIEALATGIRAARTSADEMKDGAEHACADARHVANTMASLELESQRIGQTIEAVVGGSDSALASSDRVLGATEKLESRLGGIDEIIGVIRNLAERTKLLSINASIIATEAGEHGRAFAVVANEIKDLAGSTSRAISEISAILSTLKDGFAATFETILASREDVNRGVSTARNAVVMLRSLPDQIRSTATLTNEIVMRNEVQVKKGAELGLTFARMTDGVDQVGELLQRQISRDEAVLEMYLAIGRSADQVHKSAKEHAAAVADLARVVDRANEEFRGFGRRVSANGLAVDAAAQAAERARRLSDEGRSKVRALSRRVSEIVEQSASLREVVPAARPDGDPAE